MALDIVLYDTSPTVQKIFSHILYSYAPNVYRTDQPKELIEKVKSQKPDLVFVDYSVSLQPDKKIDEQVQKNILESTPLVLMVRGNTISSDLESYPARAILKKPISADQLKELITRFVPKAKSNLLTKHLRFPPMPDFEGEQIEKEQIEKEPTSSKESISLDKKENSEESISLDKKENSEESIPLVSQSSDPSFELPKVEEPELPKEPESANQKEQADQKKTEDSFIKKEDPVTIKILEDSSSSKKDKSHSLSLHQETQTEHLTQVGQYQSQDSDNSQQQKTENQKTQKQEKQQLNQLFKIEGERIIREEARKILWKVVPEMTKKVIEDKLQQILEDDLDQKK